ncbi:MAG TPA: LptF/LptG family permease [Candidatus Krumholzibacteria bacterium]|jgi:lipopolysaccharide export system permease protein|nr:LptF/LptG family permease [Candidatus Krumholzibacteria bacterium]
MRIHDRYVLALFVRVLIFCILSLAVIFLLVDLFEKIDDFIDHQASVQHVARFYLFMLPEIVRLTLPVNVMLATIITLGILARNNEVVAFVASGVSMLRLTAPILLLAALGVAFSGLLAEHVVPRTNAAERRILRVDIEKSEPEDARVRHSFAFHGEGDVHWDAKSFNTRTQTLRDVTVFRYLEGRVLWRVEAKTAVWQDGAWEFHDGNRRQFVPDSLGTGIREELEPFTRRRFPELAETPEDLARLEPIPEAMNYFQLRSHVDRLRRSGAQVNDYLVDLYTKISYPFTTLIMAILGVGLSASKRKPGLLTGVGLTLTIAFSYLALTELSAALGKNESIPPVLAAWLGPLFFGVASLGLFARINR